MAFALLEKLRAVKKRLDRYPLTWMESDVDGLVVKTERWPFPPFEQWVYWDEVNEIEAFLQDCFCYHIVGLLFHGPWKRPVKVCDDQKGWDSLLTEVEKRYTGFNRHNLREVEKFLPGQVCLPCWNRTKLVSDLELRQAEKRIVWTQDGSTFYEWK